MTQFICPQCKARGAVPDFDKTRIDTPLCHNCKEPVHMLHSINGRMKLPIEESLWKHHNGNLYRVIMVVNGASEKHQKYPLGVVYKGENARVWHRPLHLWYQSMTEVKI